MNSQTSLAHFISCKLWSALVLIDYNLWTQRGDWCAVSSRWIACLHRPVNVARYGLYVLIQRLVEYKIVKDQTSVQLFITATSWDPLLFFLLYLQNRVIILSNSYFVPVVPVRLWYFLLCNFTLMFCLHSNSGTLSSQWRTPSFQFRLQFSSCREESEGEVKCCLAVPT